MGGPFTSLVGQGGAVFKLGLAHDFAPRHDEGFVSPFLQHAEEIFSTALAGGPGDCEWALLVSPEGGIHMLAANGWQLEPLRIDHGAREAFRVTRSGGRVRVEARSAGGSCFLESGAAPAAFRPVLSNFPQYLTVAGSAPCSRIPPADR
jgi:hypothetical protein